MAEGGQSRVSFSEIVFFPEYYCDVYECGVFGGENVRTSLSLEITLWGTDYKALWDNKWCADQNR